MGWSQANRLTGKVKGPKKKSGLGHLKKSKKNKGGQNRKAATSPCQKTSLREGVTSSGWVEVGGDRNKRGWNNQLTRMRKGPMVVGWVCVCFSSSRGHEVGEGRGGKIGGGRRF